MEEFELIYKENYIILYKYLISIGCPLYDVDDMIQETFVKAMLQIHTLKDKNKMTFWLCTIAKNTWYSSLRKKKYQQELMDEALIKDLSNDHSISFLEYIENPYKSVFVLREVMGYEYKEIADKYGKSESWARVTYYRARMKYQKLFEEDEK